MPRPHEGLEGFGRHKDEHIFQAEMNEGETVI